MNAQALASAKISRPLVPGDVLMRERLFELLDSGRKRPVIWVSGLAGSGKTTLVSSYTGARDIPGHWYRVDAGDSDPASLFYYLGLADKKAAPRRKKGLPLFTPEYAMGLDRFAQRFFEDLFTRLKTPGLLVFDNVQEVPDESLFHQVILEGISRIPEGLSIVLVSRSDPPPPYSRLIANREVEVIKGEQMRLDNDELLSILESHGYDELEDGKAAKLNDRVDGWMAGVVLMLGSGGPESFALDGGGGATAGVMTGDSPAELFDYFAREIWSRVDEWLQEFLMKTSYLPAMTSKMAEELSGNVSAGTVLSDLSRQNLFTVKFQRSPVQYQYHPLFTDFLKVRALEHFTAEALDDLQTSAARILAGSGQVEEAVRLLVDAQVWPNAVELILSKAQGMVMQGRIRTLLEWIETLPEQLMDEVPWLLYWRGMCCFQMARPDTGEWLLKAWSRFKEEDDRAGALLSLSCICANGFYLWQDFNEIDHWIDEMKQLLGEDGEFPSLEIEGIVVSAVLMCLIYKRPYPNELQPWLERALNLARESPDVGLRIRTNCVIANYYSWTGDFEKFTTCLRSIKRERENEELLPFDQINILVFESMNNWLTGDIEGCRERVNRGLELACDTGIHVMSPYLTCQMIYAALSSEDTEEAGKHIANYRKMFHPENQLHSAHYNMLAGWEALISGDLRQALSDMKLSVRMAAEAGLPYPTAVNMVGMANVCIEIGDHDGAQRELEKANAIAEQMESHQLKFLCQTGWGYLALKKDDEKALLKHLELMMAEGKTYEFSNSPMWRPPVMSQLCAKALEYGIQVDYARNLIRKRNLVPPEDSLQDLDNWPWPVRINTLGPFSLIRDGEPVRFSGKAQKRPLELLKALIALGGREVSTNKLVDNLWPDSDGDLAQNSFNAALHRLRKLIGVKDALTLQEGRLSLDPRFCRVDLWAFEEACEAADEAFGDDGPKEDQAGEAFPSLARKALDLFDDQFLPDDLKQWAISPRERTRIKYSRVATRLGRYLEERDEHEKAIDCYLKALDIDDLAEEVYAGLMKCYETAGRRADAVSLYERCRSALSQGLGVEPSPEIEAVYKRIRKRIRS